MNTINAVIALRDKMSPGLVNITTKLRGVQNGLDAIAGGTSSFTKVGSKAGGIFSKLFVSTKGISASFSRADMRLRGLNASVNSSMGLFSGLGATIKGALGMMAGFSIGNTVIRTLQNSVQSAMDRIDTMTSFKRKMKLITGDEANGDRALEALKESTTGTPYKLTTATMGVQNFVTRGLSTDEAVDSVNMWMDAVSAYGMGTSDELESVLDALGKMRTKGTVEMKQLNRLFNVGINPVKMYADAVGAAASDVSKALTNKEISADTFIKVVEYAMRTGRGGVTVVTGQAKKAATTWKATIDNMQAAVTRGTTEIIESLDRMMKATDDLGLKILVKGYGKVMEKALTGVAGFIDSTVTPSFVNLVKAIKNLNGMTSNFGLDYFKGMWENFKGQEAMKPKMQFEGIGDKSIPQIWSDMYVKIKTQIAPEVFDNFLLILSKLGDIARAVIPQIVRLGTAFADAFVELTGQQLPVVMRKIAEDLGYFADRLAEYLPDIVDNILPHVKDILKTFMAYKGITTAASVLSNFIGILQDGMWLWWENADRVALLGGAFLLLKKNGGSLTDMFENFHGKLERIGKTLDRAIREIYAYFTKGTINEDSLPIVKFIDKLMEKFDKIKEACAPAIENLKNAFGHLGDMLGDAWDRIAPGNDGGTDDFFGLIGDGILGLCDVISGLLPPAINLLAGFVDGIASLGDLAMPYIIDGLKAFFNWIQNNADQIPNIIAAIVAAFIAWKTFKLASMVTDMFGLSKVIAIVIAALAGLALYLVYLYNTSDDFKAKWNDAWNLKNGMAEGPWFLVSLLRVVWETAKVLVAGIVAVAKDVWGIIQMIWTPIQWLYEKFLEVKDMLGVTAKAEYGQEDEGNDSLLGKFSNANKATWDFGDSSYAWLQSKNEGFKNWLNTKDDGLDRMHGMLTQENANRAINRERRFKAYEERKKAKETMKQVDALKPENMPATLTNLALDFGETVYNNAKDPSNLIPDFIKYVPAENPDEVIAQQNQSFLDSLGLVKNLVDKLTYPVPENDYDGPLIDEIIANKLNEPQKNSKGESLERKDESSSDNYSGLSNDIKGLTDGLMNLLHNSGASSGGDQSQEVYNNVGGGVNSFDLKGLTDTTKSTDETKEQASKSPSSLFEDYLGNSNKQPFDSKKLSEKAVEDKQNTKNTLATLKGIFGIKEDLSSVKGKLDDIDSHLNPLGNMAGGKLNQGYENRVDNIVKGSGAIESFGTKKGTVTPEKANSNKEAVMKTLTPKKTNANKEVTMKTLTPAKDIKGKSETNSATAQLQKDYRDMADIGGYISRNLMAGMLKGLLSSKNEVTEEYGKFIVSLKKLFVEGFQIHSPSRFTRYISQMLSEGMKEGWSQRRLNIYYNQALIDLRKQIKAGAFNHMEWMRAFDQDVMIGILGRLAEVDDEAIKGKEIEGITYPIDGLVGKVVKDYGKNTKTGRGAKGMDIEVPKNARALSIESGKVIESFDDYLGYGPGVKVQHKDNLESLYAGLGTIVADEGTEVLGGTTLGRIQRVNREEKDPLAKLHFELFENGKNINPKKYIGIGKAKKRLNPYSNPYYDLRRDFYVTYGAYPEDFAQVTDEKFKASADNKALDRVQGRTGKDPLKFSTNLDLSEDKKSKIRYNSGKIYFASVLKKLGKSPNGNLINFLSKWANSLSGFDPYKTGKTKIGTPAKGLFQLTDKAFQMFGHRSGKTANIWSGEDNTYALLNILDAFKEKYQTYKGREKGFSYKKLLNKTMLATPEYKKLVDFFNKMGYSHIANQIGYTMPGYKEGYYDLDGKTSEEYKDKYGDINTKYDNLDIVKGVLDENHNQNKLWDVFRKIDLYFLKKIDPEKYGNMTYKDIYEPKYDEPYVRDHPIKRTLNSARDEIQFLLRKAAKSNMDNDEISDFERNAWKKIYDKVNPEILKRWEDDPTQPGSFQKTKDYERYLNNDTGIDFALKFFRMIMNRNSLADRGYFVRDESGIGKGRYLDSMWWGMATDYATGQLNTEKLQSPYEKNSGSFWGGVANFVHIQESMSNPLVNLLFNPFNKKKTSGYATGTTWARRGLHWVGEEGPELMSFRGGETVIPHDQSVDLANAAARRRSGTAGVGTNLTGAATAGTRVNNNNTDERSYSVGNNNTFNISKEVDADQFINQFESQMHKVLSEGSRIMTGV